MKKRVVVTVEAKSGESGARALDGKLWDNPRFTRQRGINPEPPK